MDLAGLTLTQLRDALRDGEATSTAATQAMLDRIIDHDNEILSYLTVTDEMALEQAASADSRRARGDTSPLLGIPVAVKDMLCVSGAPTTAGSRILEGFVPPYNAFAVDRLIAAGAVILGKTVTSELATLTPARTKNPANLAHTPGGSSAGSAAVVACGMVPAALGTQTAGSVIRPASFCGVYGFKP
ncbi:MAG TPA: amidase, partial [Promineifilum sp.]